jgi:hypothetical protein
MNAFPFFQLPHVRPGWCPIDTAESVVMAAGEVRDLGRSDAARVLLVAAGSTPARIGELAAPVAAGELALVAPGQSLVVGPAAEPVAAVLVAAPAQPPFRAGVLAADAAGPVPFPPVAPMASPQRRGIAFHFDETRTFSPSLLTVPDGGDVLLAANLGALSKAQAREIRQHCIRAGQALAVLQVATEDLDHVRCYFDDPGMDVLLAELMPWYLATSADLATPAGPRIVRAMRDNWTRLAGRTNTRLAVTMPLRPWTEEELRQLFGYLATEPPATLGLILDWEPALFPGTPANRRLVEALMPWTVAIVHPGLDGYAELCHYAEGAGFQGWVLRR